mgnify:CR=1 FL=1
MKSVKEKRKIQEEKTKDIKRTIDQTPNVMDKASEKEKKPIIRSEKSLEMKPFEETFVNTDNIYTEIQDEIDMDRENQKNKRTLEIEKEDILKGIIYSEILSPPKSLRK